VFQNPAKGLLASLFDFPMVQAPGDVEEYISSFLAPGSAPLLGGEGAGPGAPQRSDLGSVTHLFSHIRRTMHIRHVQVRASSTNDVSFDLAQAAGRDQEEEGEEGEEATARGQRFGILPQAVRWMSAAELEDEQAAVPKTLRKAYALLLKHRAGKGRCAKASSPSPAIPATPATKGKGPSKGKRSTPSSRQPSILAFIQKASPASTR
jgi:hypothetical protein